MKKSWIILSFLIFTSISAFAQPEGISNLTALSTGTEGYINLEWTVPDTGIALSTPTAYVVKYATSQINNSDFYAAWTSTYAYSQSWTNLLSSGTAESRPLTGLVPGATLYFSIIAVDSDTVYGLWFSSNDTAGAVNNANFACVLDSSPAQVAGLNAAENVAAEALDIYWTANSNTDIRQYRIERSTYSNSNGFTFIADILNPGTTHQDKLNLINGNTYYYKVRAEDNTGNTGRFSAVVSTAIYWVLNTGTVPPNTFNLIAPVDNTRQLSLQATFYWEPTIDPDPFNTVSYKLSYSNVLSFASSTTISGLTSTSSIVNLPLDNLKYYWRVEAVGSDNRIRQSNQTLMTYTDIVKEVPQTFILNEPGYNVVISTTLKPLFTWDTATDPDPADIVKYYIEISADQNFSGSTPIPTGTDNYYQPLSDLLDQTTYFWKVRASGFQGSLVPVQVDPGFVFSATGTFTFSMVNNPPQVFSLTSPENGASVNTKKPTFTWAASADSDPNDSITYTVVVSSVSDFSTVIEQAAGLTDTRYAVTAALPETITYYWKVTSKDKKGLERLCSSAFSFAVPVINRPAAPAGLRGSISEDELTFTLGWSAVTRNSDGSLLDDLAGYNIYRSLSLQSAGTGAPLASVSAATLSYIDNSVQGGKYYYLVRAIDSSGIEGSNSLLIESLDPGKMSLVSLDQQLMAELPSDVSQSLLAENNQWNNNLAVEFTRNTSEEVGKTLRVYDLTVRDSNFNVISDYNFSTPVTLQFLYSGISLAPAAGSAAVSRSGQSFAAGELSVYWFNGVEFIRVGGYMDEQKKRLSIRITKSGQYQMRLAARASVFGIASLNPAKVFTPGVVPYEKMTFYVDNPSGDKVTGKIFDLRGEYISDIKVLGDATATTVNMEWDGSGTRKGVYIYQVEGDGKVVNGTIILAR